MPFNYTMQPTSRFPGGLHEGDIRRLTQRSTSHLEGATHFSHAGNFIGPLHALVKKVFILYCRVAFAPLRPTLALRRPTLALRRPTLALRRPTLALRRPTLALRRSAESPTLFKQPVGPSPAVQHLLYSSSAMVSRSFPRGP